MSDSSVHPQVEVCDEFTVVGTEIRTTNEAESDLTTAQIGAHWQRFYESASRIGSQIARTQPST